MFIQNIQSNNTSLNITHSDYSIYYEPNPAEPTDGTVRVRRGHLEYLNAATGQWYTLTGTVAQIHADPSMQTVINWVNAKIAEEHKLTELVEKYPALKQAKQNYELTKAMVINE
jgi:hypothetical protein